MQCAISTCGLSRRFDRCLAVDRLDLAIPDGQVTGFLGPNGSGKTTTIRMLLGLLKPSRGSIEILGKAMPSDRLAIARQVGAMVETPCHYDHLTGRENLEVTRRLLALEATAIDRVLERVDLCASAERRVGGYSLGMRQRLGIARALLGSPRLLILDEPVNALDPDGIIDMRNLIRSLAREQGLTILVSSHLLAEVEQTADYVILIHRGRSLVQGSLAGLLKPDFAPIIVRASGPGNATDLLSQHGLDATARNGDEIAVQRQDGLVAADIARLLHGEDFSIHELREERPSLEQIYLDLTSQRRAA